MSPVFAARRRAEEFAALVEDPSTEAGARYADLLELVVALQAQPVPEARPAFVADLRSQLMLAAETELAAVTTDATDTTDTAGDDAPTTVVSPARAPRRSRRERRLAALVGGFAIVSASTSMAVAAQSALPGDTLYPLKRALENLHAGVQNDPDDKGSTLLDSAAGRLDEVDELSRSGDQDAAVIASTLQDFAEQAREASDLLLTDYAENGRSSSIDQLQEFTSESFAALDRLEDVVPSAARDSLTAATDVLQQIEQDALAACPDCLGDSAAPATTAAGQLPAVLDEALGSVAVDPVGDTTAPGQGRGPKKSPEPTGQPDQPDQPTTSPDTSVPDETPSVDQPDTPATDDPPRPNTGDVPVDDPIGDIVTGATGGSTGTGKGNTGNQGSDDPVGDLLEGTGDVVDNTLGGLGGS